MMIDSLEKDIEQVKADLAEPIPDPGAPKPKEAKKVAKSKKVFKKVAKAKTNGHAKPASAEGKITLAALAEEANITPAGARRKLRAVEGLERDGRWAWADGSRELQRARKALGLG